MKITVVTPTYNEAENLPKLVSALFALPLEISILIVDDNSPDGTGQLADELALKFPGKVEVMHRPGKMGLRSAYLNGFQKLLTEDTQAIVQMDADFSHDPTALVEMAKKLEECDAVLGSRYVQGGSVDKDWPAWRKVLSAFGNSYARAILGLPFHDVTTGYRMWKRETLLQIPFEKIQSSGYVFLVEMAYLAHCLEFKIGEAPIYFADRRFGKSKMSFKIQLEAALRIWQVWWEYRDIRKAGKLARV
ncbi:MAG: polyprenol monophosphomannose synthase [Anaerolineales bacterium]|nr:polyprenol monophosphomannose synthase [Anaerolineales bacterium]MCZ2121604.1 polyprenol monophosphomannose synthase [Anaerolineales bacterium]